MAMGAPVLENLPGILLVLADDLDDIPGIPDDEVRAALRALGVGERGVVVGEKNSVGKEGQSDAVG